MVSENKPLIATVLRSGGDYKPEHVQWLHKQLPKCFDSVCFSDVVIPGVTTIPLMHNWPGWWSKLELFRPDITSDIFYLDLDTVITGDINQLIETAAGKSTVLCDFYHERTSMIGSGLMYISNSDKAAIWADFTSNPAQHMACCKTLEKWGDQGYLQHFLGHVQRWQHIAPSQVVSYKKDVASRGSYPKAIGNGQVPSTAKIVCFHGNPRPWQIKANWIPSVKV